MLAARLVNPSTRRGGGSELDKRAPSNNSELEKRALSIHYAPLRSRMLSTANAIVDAKERTQPMRKDTHASPQRRHVDSFIGLGGAPRSSTRLPVLSQARAGAARAPRQRRAVAAVQTRHGAVEGARRAIFVKQRRVVHLHDFHLAMEAVAGKFVVED